MIDRDGIYDWEAEEEPFIGPLTAEEHYAVALYEAFAALQRIPHVKGCEAADLDATCEGCDTVKPILYARDCYTLGYAGHPGAELTVFHVCADCLTN